MAFTMATPTEWWLMADGWQGRIDGWWLMVNWWWVMAVPSWAQSARSHPVCHALAWRVWNIRCHLNLTNHVQPPKAWLQPLLEALQSLTQGDLAPCLIGQLLNIYLSLPTSSQRPGNMCSAGYAGDATARVSKLQNVVSSLLGSLGPEDARLRALSCGKS